MITTLFRLHPFRLLLVSLLLTPLAAYGQNDSSSPWQFGFGAGARIPFSPSYARDTHTDFNGLAWIGIISPLLAYGGPRIELGYHDVHLTALSSADVSLQIVEISANWMWITPPHAGIEMYALLGAGAYENTVVLGRAPAQSVPQLENGYPVFWTGGVNGGVGGFFPIGAGLRGFIEVRMHRITRDAPTVDGVRRTNGLFAALNLGLRM